MHLYIDLYRDIRGGIERRWIKKAAAELGYNDYIILEGNNNRDYIENFAEYCYIKNPLGTENIKFNYYCENIQGAFSKREFKEALKILVETEKYINDFSLNEMKKEGSDYNIDLYGGIDEDLVERVNVTFKELSSVDRKRALAGIYKSICGNLDICEENYIKLHYFLGRISSVHNGRRDAPLHEDGTAVSDPLVLIEIKEMKCGQVARLAADFVDAVGGRARISVKESRGQPINGTLKQAIIG